MNFIEICMVVSFEVIFSSIFLWFGMKGASVYAGIPLGNAYCSYFSIVKSCFFSAIASLVPYIGFALSWFALFYLLKKETEAEVGELIIMVIVSKVSTILSLIYLLPLIS
ncbi:hypothetical protein MTsN2n6_18640 [Vibrio fortis]